MMWRGWCGSCFGSSPLAVVEEEGRRLEDGDGGDAVVPAAAVLAGDAAESCMVRKVAEAFLKPGCPETCTWPGPSIWMGEMLLPKFPGSDGIRSPERTQM
jgi:hypothetical protein